MYHCTFELARLAQNKCTPTLEDQLKECDDALENGDINQIEHYKQWFTNDLSKANY